MLLIRFGGEAAGIDRLPPVVVNTFQPRCLGEHETLLAQPVDNVVAMGQSLLGNRRHPFVEVAPATLFEAVYEGTFLLTVVGGHRLPS